MDFVYVLGYRSKTWPHILGVFKCIQDAEAYMETIYTLHPKMQPKNFFIAQCSFYSSVMVKEIKKDYSLESQEKFEDTAEGDRREALQHLRNKGIS